MSCTYRECIRPSGHNGACVRPRETPPETPSATYKAAIPRLPLRFAEAAVESERLYLKLIELAQSLHGDHNGAKALLGQAAETVSQAVRELLVVRS